MDLVQGYDEAVMSYSESKDVVVPNASDLLVRDRGILLHAILLDGRLIGHWRRAPPKDSVVVETIHRRPLERPEAQALEAAADRYGRYVGLPAMLSQVRIP